VAHGEFSGHRFFWTALRGVPHITGNWGRLGSGLQIHTNQQTEAEAPMKKFSMLVIAALMLTVALSVPDASACTKVDCASVFPIMLGVGY